MARPNVLLSLVRAPALPPQHAYFGSRSHTPYDRCLRFGPRVAATPARLAPAVPARLWAHQTCTGKLISASPIAPRIRLPPRVSDGEAPIGPGMTDARPGQPPRSEAIDPVPCALILVAGPAKDAAPEIDDMVAEGCQSRPVVGHAVVPEYPRTTLASHVPCSATGACIRRRSFCLMVCSLAGIRSRRERRRTWKPPYGCTRFASRPRRTSITPDLVEIEVAADRGLDVDRHPYASGIYQLLWNRAWRSP
jgi:hypothetical protein